MGLCHGGPRQPPVAMGLYGGHPTQQTSQTSVHLPALMLVQWFLCARHRSDRFTCTHSLHPPVLWGDLSIIPIWRRRKLRYREVMELWSGSCSQLEVESALRVPPDTIREPLSVAA